MDFLLGDALQKFTDLGAGQIRIAPTKFQRNHMILQVRDKVKLRKRVFFWCLFSETTLLASERLQILSPHA